MTTALPQGSVDQRNRRVLGFSPESTVDVRQVSDVDWKTLQELLYHAKLDDFNVPSGMRTDFASVPREFVWFIPRYGRYTKAAILHDYLCRFLVPGGGIGRIDADGIFLQAMRELGVPFLRRWIMWAAVRWGALAKRADRKDWWREAWRVALLTAAALPIVAPAAAIIFITRYVIYIVEWLFYLALSANRLIRKKGQLPVKKVNKPALRSRL